MTLSEDEDTTKDLLAISTEDGRILFYCTDDISPTEADVFKSKPSIPMCTAIGQLGGAAESLTGRIKDFEILKIPGLPTFFIVTGNSDGAIRIWMLDGAELVKSSAVLLGSLDKDWQNPKDSAHYSSKGPETITQVGSLLGTYEAGNRITCLKAFVMLQPEDSKPNVLTEGNTNRANGLSNVMRTQALRN